MIMSGSGIAFASPKLVLEMTYLEAGSQVIGSSVDWNEVLCPIRLSRGRGPTGGELTCRAIHRYAWSGAGYVEDELGADLLSLLERGLLSLYVVHNPTGYGQIKELVFRGMLQSVEKQFSTTENGITVVFNDWMPPNLFYVAGVETFLSSGKTIQAMNDADIWLKDAAGNKLYQGDASATSLTGVTTESLGYQPVASAICKCIEGNRRYLADLKFPQSGAGATMITAVKRGAMKRALYHGKIGTHTATPYQTPHITTMRGQSDYSRIVQQITGVGGTKVVSAVESLIPAWDPGLGIRALADPTLLVLPEYADVGRVFRLNRGGAYASDSVLKPLWQSTGMALPINENAFKIWGMETQNGGWQELPVQAWIINATHAQNPFPGYNTLPTNHNYQLVMFDAPAIYRYVDGTGLSKKIKSDFYTCQIQANFDNGIMEATVTSPTPGPLSARRIWKNEAFTELTISGLYARPTGMRKGRLAGAGGIGYSDSLNFVNELRDVLETTQGPMQSFSCRLWDVDFRWSLGTQIDGIYEITGIKTDPAENWYVEGVSYNLLSQDNSAFTTELEISREQSEYLGGLIL